MPKARSFFYAAAGVCLLALAYHFGALSAHAQVGGTIEGADMTLVPGLPSPGWRMSGVVGRTFYIAEPNGGHIVVPAPIPGTLHVIATDAALFSVMLENGDVYLSGGPSWTFIGNLLGPATPATQPTWGQIKSRYRQPAPAAQDK